MAPRPGYLVVFSAAGSGRRTVKQSDLQQHGRRPVEIGEFLVRVLSENRGKDYHHDRWYTRLSAIKHLRSYMVLCILMLL